MKALKPTKIKLDMLDISFIQIRELLIIKKTNLT